MLPQNEIIHGDCINVLKNFPNDTFDLIFADPPYSLPELGTIPSLILNKNLLNSEGVLIVEHSIENQFNEIAGFYQHKKYGAVNFSFFKRTD